MFDSDTYSKMHDILSGFTYQIFCLHPSPPAWKGECSRARHLSHCGVRVSEPQWLLTPEPEGGVRLSWAMPNKQKGDDSCWALPYILVVSIISDYSNAGPCHTSCQYYSNDERQEIRLDEKGSNQKVIKSLTIMIISPTHHRLGMASYQDALGNNRYSARH
jgi:hypothetical protein